MDLSIILRNLLKLGVRVSFFGKLLVIPISCLLLCLAGCPAGTGVSSGGRAGGGASRTFFAPATGEGEGSGAFGRAAANGDSGDGTPSSEEPTGTAPDTVSDSPIVVSGAPLGSTPGPHCDPQGTSLFFDEPKMAITGIVDSLGRREILLKTAVHTQLGSAAPQPLGEQYVWFTNPDSGPEDFSNRYGATAIRSGCVFAKVYAPASIQAQVVRLSTSILLCQPERPDAVVQGVDSFATFRKPAGGGDGPGGFWSGPASATAVLDVTLPTKTLETTLDDCGAFDFRDDLRNKALLEDLMMRRLEKVQEDNASPSDTPPDTPSWKDSVMQRAR